MMMSTSRMSTLLVSTLLLFVHHYVSLVNGFSSPIHVGSLSSSIIRHENLRNSCLAAAAQEQQSDDVSAEEGSDDESVEILPTITSQETTTVTSYEEAETKRVNVTIRYTGAAGLRPYFLTMVKNVKKNHPDVIIERIILPEVEAFEGHTIEVMVDGKTVIGKDRIKWQNIDRSNSGSMSSSNEETTITTSDTSGDNYLANGMSVFVSMNDINHAISKARKKKRPNTLYSYGEEQVLSKELSPREMKLEMLKKSRETKDHHRPLEE